ncbi:hypothetical protein, partial [Arsenophonus nasoniae]
QSTVNFVIKIIIAIFNIERGMFKIISKHNFINNQHCQQKTLAMIIMAIFYQSLIQLILLILPPNNYQDSHLSVA